MFGSFDSISINIMYMCKMETISPEKKKKRKISKIEKTRKLKKE